MTTMTENAAALKCPKCLRVPHAWKERAAYASRELFWVGCQPCCFLQGALTRPVATGLWNRFVNRWKFEHAS